MLRKCLGAKGETGFWVVVLLRRLVGAARRRACERTARKADDICGGEEGDGVVCRFWRRFQRRIHKKVEELQLTCSTKPTCALSPSNDCHSLRSERDRAIVRHLYDGAELVNDLFTSAAYHHLTLSTEYRIAAAFPLSRCT
jgi:hypothetical protein